MSEELFDKPTNNSESIFDFSAPLRRSRLFNTPFENMLRILELLDVLTTTFNIDRLTMYDFLSIYGKSWCGLNKNLHGDNRFSFLEFRWKRVVMKEAVALAVKNCLIDVVPSALGIVYQINSHGHAVVNSIDSSYASEYREFVLAIAERFHDTSDEEILTFIKQGAINSESGDYAELLD